MTRINRRCGLLAMAGLCATSLFAQTPDWPKAKPVTLLVAFAAGSSTDTVARALAQKLGERERLKTLHAQHHPRG